MTEHNAESVRLGTAFKVVVRNGFTPVDTEAYERLRAWLDQNGWPPKDWQPPDLDRAIEAATEALLRHSDLKQPIVGYLARIAVEAAAHITDAHYEELEDVWVPRTNWKERAEKAELRLRFPNANLAAERALADQLAEALRDHDHHCPAVAAYEEARRGDT